MEDAEVRNLVARLDEQLTGLGSLPDECHDQAVDALGSMGELYGEALARVLRHAAGQAPGLVEVLYGDELLRHLLMLHDLHPLSATIDDVLRPAGVGSSLPLFPAAGPGAPSPAPAPVLDDADTERCELCAEPLVGARHRHLVDVEERTLTCVCRACSLLFDDPSAANGRRRMVSGRTERLDDVALDDEAWASLEIPVNLAFFVRRGSTRRVTAFYPSPAGPMESLLELSTWERIEQDNPVLATLEPDVEGLLVHRTDPPRPPWVLGVDRCYELVGIVRSRWDGVTGGDDCWAAVDQFFAELDQRQPSIH